MCSRFPSTPQSDPPSNTPGGFFQRLRAIATRLQSTMLCIPQSTYGLTPIKISNQRLIAVTKRAGTSLLVAFVILSLSIAPLLPTPVARADTPNDTPNDTPDAPAEVMDTPDTLVNERVSSFSIAGTKLFWETLAPVDCDPDVSAKSFDEFIRRIALQGSTTRTLFQ